MTQLSFASAFAALGIALLAAPQCDRAATRQRVEAKFARVFGHDVDTNVVFVDAIDRTAGGKFRPVISQSMKAQLALPEQATASVSSA